MLFAERYRSWSTNNLVMLLRFFSNNELGYL